MKIAKIMQDFSKVLNKHNINHRINIKKQFTKIVNENTCIYDTEVSIYMVMDNKDNTETKITHRNKDNTPKQR